MVVLSSLSFHISYHNLLGRRLTVDPCRMSNFGNLGTRMRRLCDDYCPAQRFYADQSTKILHVGMNLNKGSTKGSTFYYLKPEDHLTIAQELDGRRWATMQNNDTFIL